MEYPDNYITVIRYVASKMTAMEDRLYLA